MNSLFYRLLPFILAFALGQFLYIKVDKKYEITNKVSQKLPIKNEWKGFFCYFCTVISMLILAVLGIRVFNIPAVAYYIISGFFIGIGISMAIKMQPNKTLGK